ncbi:hypothetical protein LCGC14_2582190 [marine sediment metagenome]|uniref:Uncharacterized protein n=1 Tax=marine sediment metagenome TaxID=412755 RepID=A0A0F9CQ85_9ZZZZ
MNTKRRKIQLELAFMTEDRSEAPKAVGKGTEVSKAKRNPEDPALPVLLMEEIVKRENFNTLGLALLAQLSQLGT